MEVYLELRIRNVADDNEYCAKVKAEKMYLSKLEWMNATGGEVINEYITKDGQDLRLVQVYDGTFAFMFNLKSFPYDSHAIELTVTVSCYDGTNF